MERYVLGVFFLDFVVSVLLLFAAARLSGHPVNGYRVLAGSLLGGLHSACCLLPGFSFLSGLLWRIVSLTLVGMVTYGLSISALRKGILFSFLSLALGGAVTGLNIDGIISTVSIAGVITLLCFFAFRERVGGTTYLPVELTYKDTNIRITALQDTGNMLRDPITGRQVLVIGAEVAQQLTGLKPSQLRTPIESVDAFPGLRLIPYRSVGSHNFLLALHLPKVKIGSWQGGAVVAFAPDSLCPEGTYQALTGGVI